MVTISDVARLANVSGATVSHVINKTRKVNPETVERVENAIRELGYRPNSQARGLKTGSSRLIGVINVSSIDPFFSEILYGIERSAISNGYGVVLCHSEFNNDFQMDNLNFMIDKGIDGLIVNSPLINNSFYEFIKHFNRPCVILQFFDEALAVDTIHTDDFAAAYEATRYLLDLNHRQIAYIGGCNYPQHLSFQRKLGYEKALADFGIAINPDYYINSNYKIQDGYDILKKLLSLPIRPTAVMTYSDLLAMGAMRAAADLGLSIPKDISILGYDDIESACFTIPRLTTVFQEKTMLGQLAFEQIQNRITNPSMPLVRKILQPKLIIRESCAVVPNF